MAQRVCRGIALLFHDRGTTREWVASSTSRPQFTPGKDRVPVLQEAGWAPGPVWTGAKNIVPTGIRSRTVQPVVSHYKDWATRSTKMTVLWLIPTHWLETSIRLLDDFATFVVRVFSLYLLQENWKTSVHTKPNKCHLKHARFDSLWVQINDILIHSVLSETVKRMLWRSSLKIQNYSKWL